MGTTLTGTTPQDTYDSLIKVTDNGPLSGTAKYLSDGFGNDSVLALSTTRVGIGTNAPSMPLTVQRLGGGELQDWKNGTISSFLYQDVSITLFGNATNHALSFATNGSEQMRITGAGNVGIGTSLPQSKLHVMTFDTYGAQINTGIATSATTRLSIGGFSTSASGSGGSAAIGAAHNHSSSAQSSLTFYTHNGSSLNEVGRFLPGGGLTFNGDTAAANALDDYEEGTYTATITPITSGTITVTSDCRYTKIGRQVYVQGLITVKTISLPIGTSVQLSLPIAIGGTAPTGGSFSGGAVTADASASYSRTVRSNFGSAGNSYATIDVDASTLDINDGLMFGITYTI